MFKTRVIGYLLLVIGEGAYSSKVVVGQSASVDDVVDADADVDINVGVVIVVSLLLLLATAPR